LDQHVEVNMNKVVIKIWLTIYYPVTNFLQHICPRHYENWLRVDAVIAVVQFFGLPCICV